MKIRLLIPTLLTISALWVGMGSILMTMEGRYIAAAQFIMLSMILDGLDGTLARRLKGTTAIGAELDTFVDFSSFGIAPALLAYRVALHTFGWVGLLMAGIMVLAGAWRLARFRVVDPYRGQRGYLGLPITANAGWVAMCVFVVESGLVQDEWFTLTGGPLATFVWGTSLAMCALEVSHVRYGKPTKDPLVQIVCIPLVMLLFVEETHIAVAAALAMMVYGLIYVFVSPWTTRAHVVGDEHEEVVSHPQ